MRNRTAIILALVLACLTSTLRAQELAKAGDALPQFQFDKIVMNAQGRFVRDDFVGRPMLLEFWGFK